MEIFQDLSRTLEDRWKAHEFDSLAFPTIAAEVVNEINPATNVTLDDLVDWGLCARLPMQPDLKSDFGQPPLCLVHSPRFMVQALFWLDSTTSIHQHGFSGAFHVLHGSSIHAQYEFTLAERINQHLLLGGIDFQKAELLTRGATRAITPGNQYIHALFHLDRPSVSLVVRTYGDVESGPQYDYMKPGLAMDPFYTDPELYRRAQLIRFLHSTDPSRAMTAVRDLLRVSGVFDTTQILRYVIDHRLDDPSLEDVLNIVRVTHGTHGELIADAMLTRLRERYIVESRRQVADPELRFFLALLLNIDDRETIYAAIRQRFEGNDITSLVVRWLKEITTITGVKASGGDGSNDFELAVLRAMLQGRRSADEIVAAMEGEFEDARSYLEDVGRLCGVFRNSPVLRPLFS
jgi:hypothetical protein